MSVSELLTPLPKVWSNILCNSIVTNSLNGSSLIASSSYTPTIGDGTNNFVTSTQTGTYYQIGNLYFVSIYIIWTGKGSAVGTNNIVVTLPVPIGATCARTVGTVGYNHNFAFTGSYLTSVGNSGSNQLFFTGSDNAGTTTQVLCSQVGTGGEIVLNCTYWSN